MRDDLYMITCAARTGSSFLETSLLSHPDIMSHGEVYPPTHVGSLRGIYTPLTQDDDSRMELTQYRDSNQTAFLYKYVYDAQGHRIVGHKFEVEELLLPKFAETREALRRDTDIKIIHLRRENLFQRFVSAWLVNKVTGVTEIHSDDQRPMVEGVEIPRRRVGKFRPNRRTVSLLSEVLLGASGIRVDIRTVGGPRARAVPPGGAVIPRREPKALTSNLKKVTAPSMRSIVSNYDDFKEHFAASPYALFSMSDQHGL